MSNARRDSARKRRAVLEYFFTRSETVTTVGDLAVIVADADTIDATQESVAIRLHHLVLPKLDGTVLGEYDARSRTFRFHGTELLPEEPDPSSNALWDVFGREAVGHDTATVVDALADDE